MRALPGKLAHLVVVLILVTFATVALVDLMPGSPAITILGKNATPERVEEVDHQLGLDRSLPVRYGEWVGDAVRGDFGQSLITKRPVGEEIAERFPVTLELVILALLISVLLSLPLAAIAAAQRDRAADRIVSGGSSVLIALPQFVLGLLLVYLLAVETGVFPVTGWADLDEGFGENLRYAFLPALTLALVQLPIFTRVLRADLTDTMEKDFILAAQARGVSPSRVFLMHALRPSSFSLVTLIGVSLGSLIGGAVVVEIIFGVPGIGQMMVQAILAKDLPVVQGAVAVIAISYVLINAVIDLAYAYLDPRVRSAEVRA
jgi:peptide/nickel transport system permease protein